MTYLVQAEIEHGRLGLMPLDGIMRQLQHLSISAGAQTFLTSCIMSSARKPSIAWLAQINQRVYAFLAQALSSGDGTVHRLPMACSKGFWESSWLHDVNHHEAWP